MIYYRRFTSLSLCLFYFISCKPNKNWMNRIKETVFWALFLKLVEPKIIWFALFVFFCWESVWFCEPFKWIMTRFNFCLLDENEILINWSNSLFEVSCVSSANKKLKQFSNNITITIADAGKLLPKSTFWREEYVILIEQLNKWANCKKNLRLFCADRVGKQKTQCKYKIALNGFLVQNFIWFWSLLTCINKGNIMKWA